MLFISIVRRYESLDSLQRLFVEKLLPLLRERGASAGAWVRESEPDEAIIVGTAAEETSEILVGFLDETFADVGLEGSTRGFSSLAALFPNPAAQLNYCDVPNNDHVVNPGDRLLTCPGGHGFEHGHTILPGSRCVVCGQQVN